jgi:hypothetical protein
MGEGGASGGLLPHLLECDSGGPARHPPEGSGDLYTGGRFSGGDVVPVSGTGNDGGEERPGGVVEQRMEGDRDRVPLGPNWGPSALGAGDLWPDDEGFEDWEATQEISSSVSDVAHYLGMA